jgi:hypothetical protein
MLRETALLLSGANDQRIPCGLAEARDYIGHR